MPLSMMNILKVKKCFEDICKENNMYLFLISLRKLFNIRLKHELLSLIITDFFPACDRIHHCIHIHSGNAA